MQEEELFQKYIDGRHWEQHPTMYAEKYVEFLKNKGFKGRIVDLGCGTGRDVNVFTMNGINAIGVDHSVVDIVNAKTKYPECEFDVQDIEELKFKDSSIDAYYSINVIHYVEKEIAMKQVYRTLKPGGYFFIHFNISIVGKKGEVDYHHDEEEIMSLVSDFEIVHKNIFKRTDLLPFKHEHKITELILQKG